MICNPSNEALGPFKRVFATASELIGVPDHGCFASSLPHLGYICHADGAELTAYPLIRGS